MHIYFNGEKIETHHTVLGKLIEEKCPAGEYAVAVNESFVPRSEYFSVNLSAEDKVELVAPMVGG